ncbi:MAG: ATP-binding protein [Desulfomonilia bacterium]
MEDMWKNVIGHESQIRMLRHYATSDKLPHAFLFSGMRGLGKTVVAREFFKAVNCLNSPGDPCDACRNCMKANAKSHPDLVEVVPSAAWIKVESIRATLGEIGLKPFEASVKFVIIEPAEQMNKASSNALLKNLEEPPRDTIFVLVSHKHHLLLPTITSRCQVIRFSPVDIASARSASCDPVLTRITSGVLGGIAGVDEDSFLSARSEILAVLSGADAADLSSRYFPKDTGDPRGMVPVILTIVESIVRDIMVIVWGGETLLNEELKDIPLKTLSSPDIDEITQCIHEIRRGATDNINLKVAFTELFIILSQFSLR